ARPAARRRALPGAGAAAGAGGRLRDGVPLAAGPGAGPARPPGRGPARTGPPHQDRHRRRLHPAGEEEAGAVTLRAVALSGPVGGALLPRPPPRRGGSAPPTREKTRPN